MRIWWSPPAVRDAAGGRANLTMSNPKAADARGADLRATTLLPDELTRPHRWNGDLGAR